MFIDLKNDIVVRPYERDNDKNFVLGTFDQHIAKQYKKIYGNWEHENRLKYLGLLLDTAMKFYECVLACDARDSDIIFAFLIASKAENHVFFNYTKYNYRDIGIQSQVLLPILIDRNTPITVNFVTPESIKMRNKNKVTIYDKLIMDILGGIEFEN